MGRLSKNAERVAWTRYIGGSGPEEASKRNKYNAEKTEANGRTFDSADEAKRAIDLQWLEQLGEISELRYQVSYEVIPKAGRREGRLLSC
ncbi:DUF1064 domain-containing protein [Edaphobacter modestus]|uniref:DUF1064 domain-containing protein n=1 Tax=Edaphobacter modestus TaxID=388466 RepID=UPI001A92EFA1|nr:DUF1064 domain-containing protein [Edaphobacter modestus]